MSMNTVTYTASEARKNLYSLIRQAGKGLTLYEITIRGQADSVVLMSKNELESWQETLDILTSPVELEAIRRAKKERNKISHISLLKELNPAK